MSRLALVLLAALAATAAPASEKPPRPRLCPEDAPEGVRLPPQPGCDRHERPARRTGGFRALDDGIDIRVGGRVSGTFGAGR